MADLVSVAPDFDATVFSNVLPSLEKFSISCADLITLNATDISKRANIPARDVRYFSEALLRHLQVAFQPFNGKSGISITNYSPSLVSFGRSLLLEWHTISTLDGALDDALHGGFPTRYLSEVTGESGVGKTQLLLTLLLSVQLPPPLGLSRSAVYISTEAALQTGRVTQLLQCNDKISLLPAEQKPSLSRIFSIQIPDLEAQDHIFRYQLPVLVKREDVGLVVIDSIAANYRAEFDCGDASATSSRTNTHSNFSARRSAQIVKLGGLLRKIAETENIAIVVANQVTDRFSVEPLPFEGVARGDSKASTLQDGLYRSTSTSQPPPSPSAHAKVMSLDHQQRWFTGWGDQESISQSNQNFKNPSLGLVWTNQLACRLVMRKEAEQMRRTQTIDREDSLTSIRWRRFLRVVFAPWIIDECSRQTSTFSDLEITITASGLSSIR